MPEHLAELALLGATIWTVTRLDKVYATWRDRRDAERRRPFEYRDDA